VRVETFTLSVEEERNLKEENEEQEGRRRKIITMPYQLHI